MWSVPTCITPTRGTSCAAEPSSDAEHAVRDGGDRDGAAEASATRLRLVTTERSSYHPMREVHVTDDTKMGGE